MPVSFSLKTNCVKLIMKWMMLPTNCVVKTLTFQQTHCPKCLKRLVWQRRSRYGVAARKISPQLYRFVDTCTRKEPHTVSPLKVSCKRNHQAKICGHKVELIFFLLYPCIGPDEKRIEIWCYCCQASKFWDCKTPFKPTWRIRFSTVDPLRRNPGRQQTFRIAGVTLNEFEVTSKA